MILYGEIYGPGIQDLDYGLKEGEIDLVVFDVKYKGKYVDYYILFELCSKLDLPMAPELYYGKFTQEELEKQTDEMSRLDPNQIREGCVVKPITETNHPRVGRKILKSVSATYLMRKNATEYK